MLLFRQLELIFTARGKNRDRDQQFDTAVVTRALRLPTLETAIGAVALQSPPPSGPDAALTSRAEELLRDAGAGAIAGSVRVEWRSRMRSCAGRADYHANRISLNPRLHEHGPNEIDRTLRHELAHLLAQFRARRKRILPHGPQWRAACHDLGIGDEKRCHDLPFPTRRRAQRYVYQCPNCHRNFPRVRRIWRAIACLACCRTHNRGNFDSRFRLRMVK
ncbi:MAG: hypothetical protein JWO45_699 [Spartobacteria bacterium]|nr:hypothetical protein [Spartobacteria bacterium]